MRTFGVLFFASLACVAPVAAQVRADPGVVIGNRIAVRVNVTLADDETPYSPVRGLSFAFARSAADTVIGRTDDAGVMTILLPPGSYVLSTPTPYSWKGAWYAWTMPITVRADMPAIELSRTNARPSVTGGRVARENQPQRPQQSAGEVGSGNDVAASDRTVRWLSMEAGGEGGLTRLVAGGGSDAGYGGSAAFVGGLGPFALALGYRYTRIRYGDGLDPGSLRGATGELRYHLRPGAAAVRPYLGVVGSVGRWYDSESLTEESASMRMLGGTVGAQFGLATSVRLHVAAIGAGTNIRTSSETTNNGFFGTLNVGLTFDIFSPAR